MLNLKNAVAILGMGAGLVAMMGASYAAEHEVKMLNMGPGGLNVFDPALTKIAVGDSVHFVAADKGHSAESIDGMIPDGAQPFAGKINQDISVKFDKPGVYGYKCKPHYVLGMVGLIVVGEPVNEDKAKAVPNTGKAKQNFDKLFQQVDAK